MARRRKSYWTSPGFLVAATVSSVAIYFLLRPPGLKRTAQVVTIGPAVIDGYGGAAA